MSALPKSMDLPPTPGFAEEHVALARLWTLRMLCRLDGHLLLYGVTANEFRLLSVLGIDVPDGNTPIPKPELTMRLRERLAQVEAIPIVRQATVDRNIEQLAPVLGLTRAECELLAFAVLHDNFGWMRTASNTLAPGNPRMIAHNLAAILELPEHQVRSALDPDAILIASGILQLLRTPLPLSECLTLGESFAARIVVPQTEASGLLQYFFALSAEARLSKSDYAHAGEEWNLIVDYLAAALPSHPHGVNILLHGEPGTGKTELVRAIAQTLDMPLSEVAGEKPGGQPLRPSARFGAYRLAQRVLEPAGKGLILFDEVEDIFPSLTGHQSAVAGPEPDLISKAQMDRVLEENPMPSFWVSNSIDQMDPAYVRRFDLVIRMPAPTPSVRERILHHYLDQASVSKNCLQQLAQIEYLTPAAIERAAKILKTTAPINTQIAENKLKLALSGSLEAMGHSLHIARDKGTALPYRLEYLNCDTDLTALVQGLCHAAQGRLFLSGPPGTGKSAFAKYLAEALDRPLLVKRPSDLLSMWIGESERNIGRMFRQAEREGAVLLLDEADSYLQDRSHAMRSWEITQVNEMLTQIEYFDGFFLATTNLADSMDTAALRRFDFRVKFNYLRPDNCVRLFKDYLVSLGLTASTDVIDGLRALDNLTLGDFSVIARRVHILDVTSPRTVNNIFAWLKNESTAKPGGNRRKIGFAG